MAGDLTWRQVQREAADDLRTAGVPSPDADARWLVEEAAPELDGPVTTRALAHFDAMLARRRDGEPLQYVLGHWSFRSLDLLVDPRVLIPRPETELVVEAAIDEMRRLGGTVAVDLGTGSGAIALAIAVEVPAARVWGVDRSPDAVDVARANTAGIGRAGARVTIVEGDWFGALPEELRGSVDVLVANPPYVASGDALPDEVALWEPASALLAGSDGLDDIRRIVAGAPRWLRRPGALVVELDPRQAGTVEQLARDTGALEAKVRPDLTGSLRYLVARW
ncbi:MAG TPA: peptide chain release factor N(5)-glutamine methyltransferase [Candidatus Limnocylindrales bacterium]